MVEGVQASPPQLPGETMTVDEFIGLQPGDLVSDEYSTPEHMPSIVLRLEPCGHRSYHLYTWIPMESPDEAALPYAIDLDMEEDVNWLLDCFRLIAKGHHDAG